MFKSSDPTAPILDLHNHPAYPLSEVPRLYKEATGRDLPADTPLELVGSTPSPTDYDTWSHNPLFTPAIYHQRTDTVIEYPQSAKTEIDAATHIVLEYHPAQQTEFFETNEYYTPRLAPEGDRGEEGDIVIDFSDWASAKTLYPIYYTLDTIT